MQMIACNFLLLVFPFSFFGNNSVDNADRNKQRYMILIKIWILVHKIEPDRGNFSRQ